MGETEDAQQRLEMDDQTEQDSDQEAHVETARQIEPPEIEQPGELSELSQPDELAEAVLAAEERVGVSDSLDEIAPAAPLADSATTNEAAETEFDSTIPWWPFLAYFIGWIVLTAVAVWKLIELPGGQVAYESQAYGLTVLGGIIMTAVGPLLILTVWFAVWANRSGRTRKGLLPASLLKGALVTLGGAVLWWAALIIVDYLRLGRPL